MLKHFFIWKHGKSSEEVFDSKIKLIIFRESLAKWKFLHFLMIKWVPQITLHGFPKPKILPWVDISICKKTVQNYSVVKRVLQGVLSNNNRSADKTLTTITIWRRKSDSKKFLLNAKTRSHGRIRLKSYCNLATIWIQSKTWAFVTPQLKNSIFPKKTRG